MNILLIDDDKDSRASMGQFLRELGHNVVESSDGEKALELFTTDDFPMVLSDIKMPKMTGIDVLRAISGLPFAEETDVVLFTGYGDMESVIEALRAGAYDYLQKPINVEELVAITENIEKRQNNLRKNKRISEGLDNEFKDMETAKQEEIEQLKKITAKYFGVKQISTLSESILEIICHAIKLHGDRTIPVLIEGEKGTEKDLIAKMIHYGSEGDKVPFIEINCATITPDFFESDLFGYEGEPSADELVKGQKGKLDLAKSGTLFLNSVDEIPFEAQRKLLRVIEEKEYYRVGGSKKIKADVRIVCATHENLEKRMEEGHFRKDLYYRLKVECLSIQPLNQRKEDILTFANLFLQRFSKQQKKHFKYVGNRGAMKLLNYSWPGNIRELSNVIEQAVILYDDYELKSEHIKIATNDKHHSTHTILDPVNFSLPLEGFDLEDLTNRIVSKALKMFNGNKTDTALYLGIPRRSFYSRFKDIDDIQLDDNNND